MDEEFFDCAIEGTTLKELFEHDASKKIVVIDKSGNYGTTYSSIDSLYKSPYISEIRIRKNKLREGKTQKIKIEAFPFLLGRKDRVVEKFRCKVFGNEVEYVGIDEIYLFSPTLYRLPVTKNDVLKAGLSKNDMFYFYKAIREQDIAIMKENLSDRTHPIYKAFLELDVFEPNEFKKYCDNFGDSPFVYPIYGISEISETVCMSNSFKGVTYVINRSLSHTYEEINSYKHRFVCDLGVIHAKEYIKQKLKQKEQRVRVILTSKQKFTGNFLGFIEKPHTFTVDIDNKAQPISRYTKVIGINSQAEVCDQGFQILYFIDESSTFGGYELDVLQIHKKDILLDISFKTIFDLAQFST